MTQLTGIQIPDSTISEKAYIKLLELVNIEIKDTDHSFEAGYNACRARVKEILLSDLGDEYLDPVVKRLREIRR